MNKCFIIKLPSSVDNDNLPVLGQLRINWPKETNVPDDFKRSIGLRTVGDITVKVHGTNFVDKTSGNVIGDTKPITAADGQVFLYIPNDADAVLTIDNKYALKEIVGGNPYKPYTMQSMSFDIEDIKYCTNISKLQLYMLSTYGDISALSNLTKLTYLDVSDNGNISGDISSLANLKNLTSLRITGSKVHGDISSIVTNLTKLTTLHVPTTVTITDEQKKTLTDRGCTVVISDR